MIIARRFSAVLYALGLCLGLAIAVLAIESGIENLHRNLSAGYTWWDYPVLSNGGTGIIMVGVITLFAVIFVLRGYHLLSPLVFAVSYVLLGLGLDLAFILVEKRGAPGTVTDLYASVPLLVVPGIAVTLASLIWSYRKSTWKRRL